VTQTYGRFLLRDKPCWGLREEAGMRVLAQAPWKGIQLTGESLPNAALTLLAPAEPGKIVCVGLNYHDHAKEMGLVIPDEPLIFLKAASSVLDPGKSIRVPRMSRQVEHEAELAFVIGAEIGPGHDDGDAIFGYSCANDVTARDLQKKDGQWTRAKSFDTFCPLGPWLVAGVDASALKIECFVNGELRQSSGTEHLIFRPQQILNFIADIMTLYPGDVVLTGTPSGVGLLKAGDEVEVRVEQLGSLINSVI
jgi:2-keto-4-pentenoate hydratase/2-oxohepta-3-ene-1,7-dioic acid hydratase in catechol pathway